VPKPLDKDLKAVLYALKAEDQKSTLHLSRTVRLDMMFVDQKYYPGIRVFFQLVRTGDEQQVILQPGGARASN
jgi:hypothetical protein